MALEEGLILKKVLPPDQESACEELVNMLREAAMKVVKEKLKPYLTANKNGDTELEAESYDFYSVTQQMQRKSVVVSSRKFKRRKAKPAPKKSQSQKKEEPVTLQTYIDA